MPPKRGAKKVESKPEKEPVSESAERIRETKKISEFTYMKHMFRFDPVKVLRYLPGCFFKCHTDTRKGLDHQLTVLIFPPLKNYEGGELILHTSEGDVNVEKHRNSTEWTLVMFRPDVPHEVKPLTSGVRYVFKTAFFSDEYRGNVYHSDS